MKKKKEGNTEAAHPTSLKERQEGGCVHGHVLRAKKGGASQKGKKTREGALDLPLGS